jgi:hypothetical protein
LTPGVVGEDRGGGSNLGAHVADGAHAGAGDRVDAFAVVLNNGTEKNESSFNPVISVQIYLSKPTIFA